MEKANAKETAERTIRCRKVFVFISSILNQLAFPQPHVSGSELKVASHLHHNKENGH